PITQPAPSSDERTATPQQIPQNLIKDQSMKIWFLSKRHSGQSRLSKLVDAGREKSQRPSMPRQLRIEYPGAIYHVMNRGDHRENIFKGDADRERFLSPRESKGIKKSA